MSIANNEFPQILENLDNLRRQEDLVRQKSSIIISSDASCISQLALLQSSMDMIMWLHNRNPKFNNNNETALSALRIRAFNSSASCLKLLLSGYYQPAISSLREILELSFLMDYFCLERSSIERWIENPEHKEFKPFFIRKALDNRDGFKEKKREKAYKDLCSFGTHATFKGSVMIASEEGFVIGPFLNEKRLKGLLYDLAVRLPHMILHFLHFESGLTVADLKVKARFFILLSDWWKKNAGADLVNDNKLEEVKQIAKELDLQI